MRKLKVGKPHSVDRNLVRADICRCLESFRPAIRNVVVFIHAVSADAKPADQHAVAIQARASGKENNSALIDVRRPRLKSLGARACQVLQVNIEEWPWRRAVNGRREKRLRPKTDGAVRYGRAHRYLIQVRGCA